MSGSENINMIRERLLNHLKNEKKLGNVVATDDGFQVLDFGGKFLHEILSFKWVNYLPHVDNFLRFAFKFF